MVATRTVIARESTGAQSHQLSFFGKPHGARFRDDESGRFLFFCRN
jgi:hypothetical protein